MMCFTLVRGRRGPERLREVLSGNQQWSEKSSPTSQRRGLETQNGPQPQACVHGVWRVRLPLLGCPESVTCPACFLQGTDLEPAWSGL